MVITPGEKNYKNFTPFTNIELKPLAVFYMAQLDQSFIVPQKGLRPVVHTWKLHRAAS